MHVEWDPCATCADPKGECGLEPREPLVREDVLGLLVCREDAPPLLVIVVPKEIPRVVGGVLDVLGGKQVGQVLPQWHSELVVGKGVGAAEDDWVLAICSEQRDDPLDGSANVIC